MRINKLDKTCTVAFDPESNALKCFLDQFEQSWDVPDLSDQSAFPKQFQHESLGIKVSITYDGSFKLSVDDTGFEQLPYWILKGGKSKLNL